MWPDTDPAGIVWFGVFFRYFENAEEDLYRRLGSDRTRLLQTLRVFMPRTSLQSRFRSPAKLGDELAVSVGVGEITGPRLRLAVWMHQGDTGRIIFVESNCAACDGAPTFNAQPSSREIV